MLRQLQEDILNPDRALPDILRKAKVLAYRMDVPEFKQWVNRELDGYAGNDVQLPDYRNFPVSNYGNFWCAGAVHIRNSPIPTYGLPEFVKQFAGRVELRQGVAALAGLNFEENHSLQMPWPPDLIAYVGGVGQIRPDCALQSAWQLLGKNQLDDILNTIRNRLLTFVLELEEQFPELAGSEKTSEDVPQEQAGELFQSVVIHGGQNVVGGGSQLAQTINQPSLSSQDLVALLEYVRGIGGVAEEDVVELEEALEADEEPSESGGFGTRVNAWLGKMAAKSAESAAGTVATQGVQYAAKAIAQYYGLVL
ncbi:MAG: hypothetical protein WA990_00445 [Rubrobacteraceae bacterium]